MCPTLVISGPTASGKSSLAIELARRLNGEIVACDAMQIYSGIPILSAQVPEQEREGIPHHLMGSLDLREKMDAARYRALALACLDAIGSRGHLPIVVGGTGLYLRALFFGLDPDLPPPDPELRRQWENCRNEELTDKLLQLDPAAAEDVDLKNPRRVLRALEIVQRSRKPIRSFRRASTEPPVGTQGFLIYRKREDLLLRIENRSRAMWDAGVLHEIATLPNPAGPTAESAIGLREGREFTESHRESWIEKVEIATRQYAKRQMTWFRREPWLEPIDVDAAEKTSALANRLITRLPPGFGIHVQR